jgi:hypothetical protein
MASSPDGRGYWLTASDGGVFTFGDAHYYGSTGAIHLNKPITAMVPGGAGNGYWLVASDGGVFSFGAVRFAGTLGGTGATVVAAIPSGNAYTLVEPDGSTHSYGSDVVAGAGLNRGRNTPTTTASSTAAPSTTTTVTSTTPTSAPATTVAPSTTSTTTAPAPAPQSMILGVLAANPQWMATDHASGVSEAMMNIDWSSWQPQPGVTNTNYVNQQVSIANQYRSNGWTVAIDVGLQAPPSWVLSLPDGALRSQNGSSQNVDYEYSQAVRSAASQYISSVVSALGSVSSYRIGLGSDGEMMYPEADNNEWWAFNGSAQQGGPDLPTGIASSPMPGWIPGSTSWNGSPVTAAQVSGWYNWYYGALVNGLAWEIGAFRGAGYTGALQLLMAGDGALPGVYNGRLAVDLAPNSVDEYHTMNTATVFWRMLPDLAAHVSLTNTVVDITGVYDGTGTPRGGVCAASDPSLTLQQADPWNSGWSDTRFVTYLARTQGLPVMGENPGSTVPSDVAGTIALAQSCGLTALQWAWDWQLNGGSPSVASLSQLASAWSARLTAS